MRRLIVGLLALGALAQQTNAQILPHSYGTGLRTGLVHYYRLGETGAAARVDLMGGASWTATGAPPSATGISGSGASLQIGKYLSINQTSLLPGSTFTVSFWFKPSDYVDTSGGFNGKPIMVSDTTNSGFDIAATADFNGSGVDFTRYAGSASVHEPTVPSLNNWHFIQVWSGDGASHMQIDGGTVRNIAGANITVASGAFTLSFPNTAGVTAVFDEMMVHNLIFTASERAEARRGGAGKFYPF